MSIDGLSNRADLKRFVEQVLSGPSGDRVKLSQHRAELDELGNVEGWVVVGSPDAPSFQNSWVNLGGSDAAFYKDPFGRVWGRGSVGGGTVGETIFTFPSGYRPEYLVDLPAISNFSSTNSRIVVNPDGTVVLTVGSNTQVSLDGITFRAA